MKNLRLLLHTCCAPCLVCSMPAIQKESFDASCFWYNPNIHPYGEYEARLCALSDYAQKNGIELIAIDYYGLDEFDKRAALAANPKERCAECYDMRFKETARYARQNGFDAFSTTLLASPYQNREKIIETCERYAEESGVKFFCGDFRENFREGQKMARNMGIYMQKYCGCHFSEQERFLKKNY